MKNDKQAEIIKLKDELHSYKNLYEHYKELYEQEKKLCISYMELYEYCKKYLSNLKVRFGV